MVTVTGILSKDVPLVWGSIKGFITAGLGPDDPLAKILALIIKREAQVWVAYDDEKIIAACVTELPTLDGRKVCNIISLGGSRIKEWRHWMESMEAWARSNNCAAMRFEDCRKGFARIVRGYTAKPGLNGKIILEKGL